MVSGDWGQVGFHVVEELKRLDKRCDENDCQCRKNDRRLIVVETRNAAWGAIAGMVAGALISLLVKKIGL